MAQETDVAGLTGSFCPGRIELAGSDVSFVLCEASSNDYSEVDIEGSPTGSSSF